ncbi:MAG: N-acetylglucosamine kinase [Balneola sp.]
MNILIADSGSSKTDWVWLDSNNNSRFFSSKGLNPHFLSKAEISESIADLVKTNIRDVKIDQVFFYGAGSVNLSNKKILRDVFTQTFPSAKVYIETDLLAAAKACFGKTEGIACILGTGSNTCVYDGEKIIKKIPSLGFVLGDEGSGGYFGKKLLNSYYYKNMPSELREELESKTDMDLDYVLNRVYKHPQANKFVASFTEIVSAFKDHAFIKEMVREGFEDFADKQLSYFEESRSLKIGFVGSIASVFEDVLREVLKERGMEVSIIVRNPLEKLAEYHISQLS